jgi:tRNA dimethylallyltransferase
MTSFPETLLEKILSSLNKNTESIIAIVGPTCTGKTSLSIEFSKYLKNQGQNAEIINADSRLVFVGMDIGTAKPSLEERADIVHHLIDIREPNKRYSAAQYRKDFDECLKKNFLNKDGSFRTRPIVVGGTGLYIKSALADLDFPEASTNTLLRQELQSKTLLELVNELHALDPDAPLEIDLKNPQRVIRAIEIVKLTGKKLAIARGKLETDRYKTSYIGLNYTSRRVLYSLISDRVKKMIHQGFIEEVRALHEKYPDSNIVNETIGYEEIIGFIKGQMNLDEALYRIKKRTQNYAKKQLTWLKQNKNINWFYLDA